MFVGKAVKKIASFFELLLPVEYNGIELEDVDEGVNILIAEDDNAVVSMIQNVIKGKTSIISSASTISSAINGIPLNDILILDLSLNGVPNAGRIIYDQWIRLKYDHPCIIITGDISDEDHMHFIRSGVLYVHKKPFDIHMFFSTYQLAYKQILKNKMIVTYDKNITELKKELEKVDNACLQRQRRLSTIIFIMLIILLFSIKQNFADIFNLIMGV